MAGAVDAFRGLAGSRRIGSQTFGVAGALRGCVARIQSLKITLDAMDRVGIGFQFAGLVT